MHASEDARKHFVLFVKKIPRYAGLALPLVSFENDTKGNKKMERIAHIPFAVRSATLRPLRVSSHALAHCIGSMRFSSMKRP
jgi:hypothetical protein